MNESGNEWNRSNHGIMKKEYIFIFGYECASELNHLI